MSVKPAKGQSDPLPADHIFGVRLGLNTKKIFAPRKGTKNTRLYENAAEQSANHSKAGNVCIGAVNLCCFCGTMAGVTFSAFADIHLEGVGPQSKVLTCTSAHTNASEKVTLVVEKSGEPEISHKNSEGRCKRHRVGSTFRPPIDTRLMEGEGCEKIVQLERIESSTSSAHYLFLVSTAGTSHTCCQVRQLLSNRLYQTGERGVEFCGPLQQKS